MQSELEYLCETVYKLENIDWLIDMMHNATTILIYLKQKRSLHDKHLAKKIDESIELFALVNLYEKNRGYQKLEKQAKLLKNQYEKYISGEPMKSGLEKFFDDYSGERMPKRADVLALMVHNIKQVLIFNYKKKVDEAKEMAYDIVKTVLNDDKKFIGHVLKEGILIESESKIIALDYYPPSL